MREALQKLIDGWRERAETSAYEDMWRERAEQLEAVLNAHPEQAREVQLQAELDAVRAVLADVQGRFEEHLRAPMPVIKLEGSPEALQLVRLRMSPALPRLAAHLKRLQGEGRLIDTDGSIVDFRDASLLLLGLLELLLKGAG